MDAYTEGLLKNQTIVWQQRPLDGTPEGMYPWTLRIQAPGTAAQGGTMLDAPGLQSVTYDDTTITVKFDRKHPNVKLDLKPYIEPAIPLEDSLKKYKEGYLRVLFFSDASGQIAMDEANAAAARFGVDFTKWTAAQLGSGKGPGVGPTGIPLK